MDRKLSNLYRVLGSKIYEYEFLGETGYHYSLLEKSTDSIISITKDNGEFTLTIKKAQELALYNSLEMFREAKKEFEEVRESYEFRLNQLHKRSEELKKALFLK